MKNGLISKARLKSFVLLQIGLYAILICIIYDSSLRWLLINDWKKEAYSYCYLVPFVILYLIWLKRNEFQSVESKPSWLGLFSLIPGLLFFWIGELGSEQRTLYLSLWLVIIGICWMHFGWEKLKTIGFALFYMLTMFPLPQFLNVRLMVQLRLISSKMGVAMIRLSGLPVIRQGNIIDLGFAKLQVVEACSGLNSLISLFVLSLLMVYFFKAHLWKRCVLVLSSVPLAIFTNSLRIAVTAILHKHFGPEVSQTFFHEFSGLVIFLLCIPILLLEVKILAKLPPIERKSSSRIDDTENLTSTRSPDLKEKDISNRLAIFQPVFVVAVILLGATLALSRGVEFRERIPVKQLMAGFPLEVGEWKASSREKIAQNILDVLDLSEYMMLDYKNPAGQSINFYVAYYESQSKGKSIHSPETCIPGSGWSFDKSGLVNISGIPGNPGTMRIERAVIKYGKYKQIAYFWFSLRGRVLRNLYQVKIYNFWDALIMQRTDGALVRLITPVEENEKLADADYRLQNFVREIVPVLNEYIPGKDISKSFTAGRQESQEVGKLQQFMD